MSALIDTFLVMLPLFAIVMPIAGYIQLSKTLSRRERQLIHDLTETPILIDDTVHIWPEAELEDIVITIAR